MVLIPEFDFKHFEMDTSRHNLYENVVMEFADILAFHTFICVLPLSYSLFCSGNLLFLYL